jgi:hypothetical protein
VIACPHILPTVCGGDNAVQLKSVRDTRIRIRNRQRSRPRAGGVIDSKINRIAHLRGNLGTPQYSAAKNEKNADFFHE